MENSTEIINSSEIENSILEFSVNEPLHCGYVIRIDGYENNFQVIGVIKFRDRNNNFWYEYRIISDDSELWLSVDGDTISLFSMSNYIDVSDFEEIDRDGEIVVEASGSVDVESGDKAMYVEYLDKSNDTIVAIETWEDETEYSTGKYISADKIHYVSKNVTKEKNTKWEIGSSNIKKGLAYILSFVFVITFAKLFTPSFAKFQEKNKEFFTYLTSITHHEDKCNVYRVTIVPEMVIENLIKYMDGSIVYVEEDSLGNVAMSTDSEFCIFYKTKDFNTNFMICSRDNKQKYPDMELYEPIYEAQVLFNNYKFGEFIEAKTEYELYFNDNIDSRDYVHGYYYGKAHSVRQASASRKSSGGGHGGGGK